MLAWVLVLGLVQSTIVKFAVSATVPRFISAAYAVYYYLFASLSSIIFVKMALGQKIGLFFALGI